MVSTDRIDAADGGIPALSRKQILMIWGVLVAALLPAMLFVIATEREVSQYSTQTFEPQARQALDAAEFRRTIRICTGALKIGISRSDYWGRAHLLRAEGYKGAGKFAEAVADLETSARLWSRAYYQATDADRGEIAAVGTEIGLTLLDSGDVDGARRALSAAGVGSGKPVEYLYDQCAALTPAQRQQLWPEEPYLYLEAFQGADAPTFETIVDEQDRTLLRSRLEDSGGRDGQRCAAFEAGASPKPGRSWFGIPVYVPLSEKPFGLRVRMKEDPVDGTNIVVGYWFELAHKSVNSVEKTSADLGGGWRLFDVRRDFLAERAAAAKKDGYDPAGGIINRLCLSPGPGPGVQYRVDSIEIYVPNS